MKIFFLLFKKDLSVLVKNYLEVYVDLYLGIVAFGLGKKGWCGTRVASTASEITIDGYPRSANSFSVRAFMEAQERFVRIGNHTHSPANLIRSISMDKPTILVIRKPKDAVLGYCAWVDEQSGVISKPLRRWQIQIFLRRYVDFHRKIVPYLDSLVVADFDQITSDYGKIIVAVNEKFGTNFLPFIHSKSAEQSIFSMSAPHLSPSTSRNNIKVLYEIEWEKLQNSSMADKAQKLYELCTAVQSS